LFFAPIYSSVIAQEAPAGATCSLGKKSASGMRGSTAQCDCDNENEDLVFKDNYPVLHDSEQEADGHASCDVNDGAQEFKPKITLSRDNTGSGPFSPEEKATKDRNRTDSVKAATPEPQELDEERLAVSRFLQEVAELERSNRTSCTE
jgi:hypothetical protein